MQYFKKKKKSQILTKEKLTTPNGGYIFQLVKIICICIAIYKI